MTDIVERLRDPANNWNSGGRFEAADEIDRLRAALDAICGITLGLDPCDGGGKIHKIALAAMSNGDRDGS